MQTPTNVVTAIARATLVILVYIGNKSFKEDNVCGTGVVWHGYGDKQEVDQRFLPKFLQHPDVWCTEDAFEKLPSRGVNGGVSDKKYTTVHNADGTITLIPVESGAQEPDLGVQAKSLAAAASNLEANNVPPVPDAPPPEDPAKENGAGSNDAPPEGGEIENKITNAILSLDSSNDKHFSKANGVPILSAVRAAASDDSITGEQVKAVWTKLKAN